MPPPPVPAPLEATFGPGRAWTSRSDGSATAWETPTFHLLWAPEAAGETALRRLWEARKGRQPYAVVALAPSDDPDKLLVAGPQYARPIRQLPAHRVFDLLQQSRAKPLREAAAFLTGEFSRLEEAVVPGLRVKDLLTPHFLRERLPQAPNARNLPDVVKSVTRPQNLSWRSVFQALGYQVQPLQPRGYLLRVDNAPVAVVHALNDPSLFSRLTDNGELPEGMVLADCEKQGAHWGILAAGTRYRLFQRKPPIGPATGQYLEIDLAELESPRRWYLGLLAPQSLRENGWLTAWIQEARDFGQKLREGLQERLIKDALPNLARGLGEFLESEGVDLSDRKHLRQIEEAALTLVFRFMFLLHTEARGYLPIGSAAYRKHSATQLADDSRPGRGPFGRRSTQRWDRLRTLVRMVRTGDTSAGVPAYNGSLFAAAGFPGSDLMERTEITDNYMAPVLNAIAYEHDRPEASGLDYAGLQIGHLGAIYEALLTLRLTRAPEDLAYDARRDIYRPLRAGEQPEVTKADLYYQAQAGGRKAGGVFYTRHEFVDHLLQHSLRPALDDHLEQVEKLAERDHEQAARQLFDFSVVDPAMGSAHFLTAALDMLADRIELFLAELGGLPGIAGQLNDLRQDSGPTGHEPEDGDLLRRLVLKRCIYGVDNSPMAVEVGNVTLWLASFVPGLALTYLGSNLKCGDALIGVASPNVVGASDSPLFTGQAVTGAMSLAVKLQRELAENPDRNPDEVKQSEKLGADLREATTGLRHAFNLWAAEPLGLAGARHALETHAGPIVASDSAQTAKIETEISAASHIAERFRLFHWPLEFPNIFHRERPGFDVVVGNPPWDKIKFELFNFLALHDPGIHGVRSALERDQRAERLFRQRPQLRQEIERRRQQIQVQREFFRTENGYTIQGSGDTDLYKLFCERYASISRRNGFMGVVLPRVAFLNAGSRGFRRWFFRECRPSRMDAIVNTRRWAFDIHPQNPTIALVTAQVGVENTGSIVATGPSRNAEDFLQRISSPGVQVNLDTLAAWTAPPTTDSENEPTWELPLLPSTEHFSILRKLRSGVRFEELVPPRTRKDSQSRADVVSPILYTELHSSNQRNLFTLPPGDGRIPVWKGSSFDQYDPHQDEVAGFADPDAVVEFVSSKYARSPTLRRLFGVESKASAMRHTFHSARTVFRKVGNRTNSRTVVACLIPPSTPLTDAVHCIAYGEWSEIDMSAVLGISNSIAFDWLARRYIEANVSFFIFYGLTFPSPESTPWQRIGSLAARLSCVDERYIDFAIGAGVDCGSLADSQSNILRSEIDVLVARAYELTKDELRFVLNDFTENAVTAAYRELVLDSFESL